MFENYFKNKKKDIVNNFFDILILHYREDTFYWGKISLVLLIIRANANTHFGRYNI